MKVLIFLLDRFYLLLLLTCTIVVLIDKSGIIDISPHYYLITYAGIPFAIILYKVDVMEKKVMKKLEEIQRSRPITYNCPFEPEN